MNDTRNAPGISPEAQAAIAAQQRVLSQELALELQLRNAALHEAVEAMSRFWSEDQRAESYAKAVNDTAVSFLKFLQTGESK